MIKKKLNLDENENVLLEVRRHWIIFLGHSLALLFAAVLPFAVFTLFKMFLPEVIDAVKISGNQTALFTFFYCLWLLFLWCSFFIEWTKYYLDVWYVTEKRIIDIEQRGLFSREITNLRFDKIQDVTIDTHGFIATLLGFGNIRVQTAAEDSRSFYMATVSHPERVRQVIFNQHNISQKSDGGL